VSVWAPRSLTDRAVLGWRLGPLTLRVHRRGNGVGVSWRHGEDTGLAHVDDTVAPGDDEIRLLCRGVPDRVALEPVLADRNVVFRAERPLTIAAGGTATAYVTSPLWVRLRVGGAVHEIPSHRPTDTWFGTPLAGELCYAAVTSLRVSLDDLPARPHRAVTEVRLRARDTDLVVRRLLLPMPELAVYRGPDGRHWSDIVDLQPERDDLALVRAQGGPPSTTRASEPRRPARASSPLRVFNAFFG
jgi:hypothetical protein